MKAETILTHDQIENVKKTSEVLCFPNDFDVIYKQQLLPGVILLLSGEIHYLQKNGTKVIHEPGRLIGLKHVTNNRKALCQVRIKAGSEIMLIGRSGIVELMRIIQSENQV